MSLSFESCFNYSRYNIWNMYIDFSNNLLLIYCTFLKTQSKWCNYTQISSIHRFLVYLFNFYCRSYFIKKNYISKSSIHSFRNNGHPYLSIHRHIYTSRTKLSLSNSFIRENVKRYELRYSLFLSITLLCINNKLRIKILF